MKEEVEGGGKGKRRGRKEREGRRKWRKRKVKEEIEEGEGGRWRGPTVNLVDDERQKFVSNCK